MLVWFTLAVFNDQGSKYILDSVADFDLGTVADKLGGGAASTNNILESRAIYKYNLSL